ncbi:MAG: FAD-dependent oxidoreductase [Caldilineaceae bacterium]
MFERVAKVSDGKVGDGKVNDGAKVFFSQNDKTQSIQGSHLLVAAGRAPNTDQLNLDAAGVQTSDRGYIEVNDVLQSSVPHIYALGDVNGQGAFTHTSVNDGQIFWDHYSGTGDRTFPIATPSTPCTSTRHWARWH